MCGRYVLAKRREQYLKMLYAEWRQALEEERAATWNLAPTAPAWVIRNIEEMVDVSLLKWGFGVNDAGQGMAPINVRVETAAEKSLFEQSWRERRCLVPADGWYEWRAENDGKQPYYFSRRDKEPIFFAGLWTGKTFAIVTTAAEGELRNYHERKPLSLNADAARSWVRKSWQPDELMDAAIKSDEFEIYPVSPAVSNWKNDGPQLIEKAAPVVRQQMLF